MAGGKASTKWMAAGSTNGVMASVALPAEADSTGMEAAEWACGAAATADLAAAVE
jgi:hypothetical protein